MPEKMYRSRQGLRVYGSRTKYVTHVTLVEVDQTCTRFSMHNEDFDRLFEEEPPIKAEEPEEESK